MGAVQRAMAAVGAMLLAGGLAAWAVGATHAPGVLALAERVGPVLAFVAAITVVAELSDEAGVFAALAAVAVRLGRGRAWLLWLIVAGIAIVATVFLSLDTTAVLLTPVVLIMAWRVGLEPLAFAFTTVWLANTASLLLPVSNLTNLLAHHRLGSPSPLEFAGLLWRPAIVAVAVPLAVIAVVFRATLRHRYVVAPGDDVADPVRRRWACVVVALLLPALVSGVAPWIPATIAAAALVLLFAARSDTRAARPGLVPWPLLLFVAGLFLVMEIAADAGLTDRLAALGSHGPLAIAATGAVGANVINNLPAYLALEPVAGGGPERLAALLVGVNTGPLVTPWASLATLLWHQRLEAAGVQVPWLRFMMLGLLTVVLTVPLAMLAV